MKCDLEDKIRTIRIETTCDSAQVKNVNYKEIMAVYSVLMTNREKDFNIIEMNEENYKKLQEIYDSVPSFLMFFDEKSKKNREAKSLYFLLLITIEQRHLGARNARLVRQIIFRGFYVSTAVRF